MVGNLYSTHKGLSQGREGDVSACLCTGHLGLKSSPHLPMLGKLRAGTPFWRLPGGRRRISRRQHRPWESPAQHSLPGYGSGNPGPGLRAMHLLASPFQLREEEEEDNQKRVEHRGQHLLGPSCIASPCGKSTSNFKEATISFIFPALFHLSGCERS